MEIFKKSPKKNEEIQITSMTTDLDLNDPLVKKIQQNLNIEQQEMFIQSFYSYLNCDKEQDFIVDLDSIYQWMGYTQKVKAKELLERHFIIDVDYIVALYQTGKRKNEGGYNKKTFLMNIKTFKKLCMKADTKKADKIHDYYIKMEDIMMEHTKEQLLLQSEKLKEKDNLLQQKEQELLCYKELVYEEVDKIEIVYVFSTDKIGVYKIGKTINLKGRKSSSNTLLTDDIQIVFHIKTNCCKLVEEIVHFVLHRYRSNSNRELFRCDLNYIKTVIKIVASTVDTLKSSFHTISQEDIFERLNEKISTNYVGPPPEEQSKFHNWMEANILLSNKTTDYIELKTICETFLERENVPPKVSSKLKQEVEKFIKRNRVPPLLDGRLRLIHFHFITSSHYAFFHFTHIFYSIQCST